MYIHKEKGKKLSKKKEFYSRKPEEEYENTMQHDMKVRQSSARVYNKALHEDIRKHCMKNRQSTA